VQFTNSSVTVTVSFSAFTLLIGWQEGKQPVPLNSKGSLLEQVEKEKWKIEGEPDNQGLPEKWLLK